MADKRTFNAVIRSLEVIGEAAKNVPDEIRAKYPLVPWKEMAGMRDKVIHFYFGVDREAVWIAVKDRGSYACRETLDRADPARLGGKIGIAIKS